MTIPERIEAVQEALGLTVDGYAGPVTWKVIYDRIVGVPTQPVHTNEPVDDRSEKKIATLLPPVQVLARSLLHAAAAKGITLIVTSGTRTYEEQDALYAQGRTKPGRIVTQARGGYSNHNFGLAFDVTIFNGTTPVWESPLYRTVGELGKALGLEWGGDWAFKDEPHMQLQPPWATGMNDKAMLAELRRRKGMGQDLLA